MKTRGMLMLTALCLLLGGCSLLERDFSSVEPHNSRYWESEADTLRAENYQDLVNDLLLLVGQHTENAVIRLYDYEDDMTVSEALEQASSEVQQETPMGAYAVEYITSASQAQRGYYEITVSVRYRRTAEQIQSVVNATSTEALPELLNAALQEGKTELAVRIGYFNGEQATVERMLSELRSQQGLSEEAPPWGAYYYPSETDVGLIEFVLDGSFAPEEGIPSVNTEEVTDEIENPS